MRRLQKFFGNNEVRFVLLFIACIWLAAYAKSTRDQQIARSAGETVAKNTARLVEQNVVHAIGELDKALLYLRARQETERESFNLHDAAYRWQLMTKNTVQMAHIAPDGIMLDTTVRPAPTGRVDLGDREHFKAHLNTDRDRLFISKPVTGRASKKSSVQLSRKISNPDRSFGGVLVVSLDPLALSAFYKSIDLGDDAVIALIGQDGIVRATGNEQALALGQDVTELNFVKREDATNTGGQRPYLASLKDIDRLIAVRSVAGLPLAVIVGISSGELYSVYYGDLFWTIVVAGVLTVLLASAAVMHHRRQRALRLANLRVLRGRHREKRARELEKVNANINELNIELAKSIVQLREAQDESIRKGKLAQLGQLTATVAHEIRNPLGTVRTAAFLVEKKIRGANLGVEKQFERINNGIARCDKIITELIDFARSKPLVLKAAEVDEWARKTVEDERKNIPAMVTITFEPGLGNAKAAFDTERMGRVLINLMSNASEAMVGNGRDLPASPVQDPEITVRTQQVGGNVEITVLDNGPGICEEDLKKILEPLFSVKSFGVGLGLPAVEKILEHHGGGLRISSKVGKGTSMTAWFPMQQATSKVA